MTAARETLVAGSGFILWSAAFVVLYGLMSIACFTPAMAQADILWRRTTLSLSIVFALFIIAHMIAVVLSLRRKRQATGDYHFIARTGLWLNVAALLATIGTFGFVILLPPCE